MDIFSSRGSATWRAMAGLAALAVAVSVIWVLTWAETRSTMPGHDAGQDSTEPKGLVYTVECLDAPGVRLPLPADELVHYLSFAPHRFRLTFARAMDRSSVEAAILASFEPENLASVGEFLWADSKTVEFTLQPPPVHDLVSWGEPWSPDFFHESSQDMPVETGNGETVTLGGYLAFKWGCTYQVRRVPAAKPTSGAETVFDCPAGVIPLAFRRDGDYLLGVQFAVSQFHAEQGELSLMPWFPVYSTWLYRSRDGQWLDLAEAAAADHGTGTFTDASSPNRALTTVSPRATRTRGAGAPGDSSRSSASRMGR